MSGKLTCAGCGKPMAKNSQSSLPQGKATCHTCRYMRRSGEAIKPYDPTVPEPPDKPCRTEGCERRTQHPYSYCEPCRVERAKPKPPTRYPFDCLLCGRHFETRTPRRVFCCDACTVAGKEILRSVDARWNEALVNRGDRETSELIVSVVLPSDVLKIHGVPRCPDCGQAMQVVTDFDDYGCMWCYVKVTLL